MSEQGGLRGVHVGEPGGDGKQRLEQLLATVVDKRGQDLLLTAGAPPSVRVDNELERLPLAVLRPEDVVELVRPIMTKAQLDAFDAQRELDFGYGNGSGRFRCNLYQQRGSLSFTARRILEDVPSAKELGLPPFLGELALKAQGLILVVGPNGHGKSTTVAWMVDHINRHRRANIVTLEDPIEYHHEHRLSNVNQREVGSDTSSFHESLRRVVRQNPDVIVIGELRDQDSFATALSAAETGHLVLGTLHTVNATATIERIVDFFPANEQGHIRSQIAETLLLVFSQRLLRRAAGKGRALAWERISSSTRVKGAIRDGRTHQLRSLMQGNHEDLVPLDHSLAELLARHVVTREEAMRFAENPAYVDEVAAALRAQEPRR